MHSLTKKGVLTDYASRKINDNGYVDIKYLAKACRYFNVPIEAVVEVIPEKQSPESN